MNFAGDQIASQRRRRLKPLTIEAMGNTYSAMFPPAPPFTEAELESQEGKVVIVTGGYSGVGLELSSILYHAGATVYMAGRSEEKAAKAIGDIKAQSQSPSSHRGRLEFLPVSLDDLSTIRPAAERFLAQESRLDVLFNNAGVSNPPRGTISAQGHEYQLATNCLGPYLLTKLLGPILKSTAGASDPGAVRLTFTTSIASDHQSPRGGVDLSHLNSPPPNQQTNYATSKTINWFLADHFARQLGPYGVLSVAVNPGNLKTNLLRHFHWLLALLVAPLLYHARFGAYANLWAGFSPDVTVGDGGRWVEPFGRFHPAPRPDMLAAFKSREDGGTGVAREVIDFCDKATTGY